MPARRLHIGARPTAFEGGAQTRVFALIGHPVRDSLSPVFQNAALRALGVDATYVAVDVPSDEFSASMERVRRAACEGVLAGVNVTVPHKTRVVEHLDGLDAQARALDAVNTLCFAPSGDDVHVEGRNTDVDGIRAALDDAGVSMHGVAVVVVGAGGAARAAVWAALGAGAASIGVVNRHPERAEQLLAALTSRATPAAQTVGCWAGGFDALTPERLGTARVLIQTTSLGLAAGDPSPVDLVPAAPELFVLETIYQRETALVRAAAGLGLRHADGRGMLVHQGAHALQAWTGLEAPVEVMKRSLKLPPHPEGLPHA